MAVHLASSLLGAMVSRTPLPEVPSTATDLVLVRHGETTWNRDRRIQGQMESDLNDVGRQQARAVAARLASGSIPFSAIYTSDLRRAADTAQAIADSCGMDEVVKVPGLRERHAGDVQGLTPQEASEKQPAAYRCFLSRDPTLPIPGHGESLNMLRSRVVETLTDIARKRRGQRVVVVCHGGVIIAVHRHITGKNPSSAARNASINIVRVEESGDWDIVRWGDVEHLTLPKGEELTFGGGVDSA